MSGGEGADGGGGSGIADQGSCEDDSIGVVGVMEGRSPLGWCSTSRRADAVVKEMAFVAKGDDRLVGPVAVTGTLVGTCTGCNPRFSQQQLRLVFSQQLGQCLSACADFQLTPKHISYMRPVRA